MKVITNSRPRPIIYWWGLTDKEKKEFDYLKDDDARDSASFFRYKGGVYDTNEFMVCPRELKPWDGYRGDSFFSGIVIRFIDDESVIVGLYLA